MLYVPKQKHHLDLHSTDYRMHCVRALSSDRNRSHSCWHCRWLPTVDFLNNTKKTFGILTNKKIDFYKIHWFVALLICLLFWLLSFHRPKTLSLDFQRKQQQQQQIKPKLGKFRRREEEEEQKKKLSSFNVTLFAFIHNAFVSFFSSSSPLRLIPVLWTRLPSDRCTLDIAHIHHE